MTMGEPRCYGQTLNWFLCFLLPAGGAKLLEEGTKRS